MYKKLSWQRFIQDTNQNILGMIKYKMKLNMVLDYLNKYKFIKNKSLHFRIVYYL